MLQAAQVRHSTEIDEERRRYVELYRELQGVDDQVHAHCNAADEVHAQLVQVSACSCPCFARLLRMPASDNTQ